MFVVFDLDGTLRDPRHRVDEFLICPELGYPHLRDDPDWDAFFLACKHDNPISEIIALIPALMDAGHRVEIWTGASENSADATILWLLEQADLNVYRPSHVTPAREAVLRQGDFIPLVMRPHGDRTDDHELKTGWISERGKPDLVFEDRTRVVKKWRELGVICCQVADADF